MPSLQLLGGLLDQLEVGEEAVEDMVFPPGAELSVFLIVVQTIVIGRAVKLAGHLPHVWRI